MRSSVRSGGAPYLSRRLFYKERFKGKYSIAEGEILAIGRDRAAPMPRLESTGLTDIGARRRNNQGVFLVDNGLGLYVVADGLGGPGPGRSAIVVKTIKDYLKRFQGPETVEETDADRTHGFARGGQPALCIVPGGGEKGRRQPARHGVARAAALRSRSRP